MSWQEIWHQGLGCSPERVGLMRAGEAGLTFQWPETTLPETTAYLEALDQVGSACTVAPVADPEASGAQLISTLGGIGAPVVALLGRGTGATTLAWELACHWQAGGRKIGVLDLDVRHPGLFPVAGVDGRPAVIGRAIVPRAAHGVRLLGLTAFLPQNRPPVARGPDLERMCRTFRDDALWQGLDLMLVDLPDLPEVAAMQAALFSVRQTVRLIGPLEPEPAEAPEGQDIVFRLGRDLPIDPELALGGSPGARYRRAVSSLAERIWAAVG